MLCRQDGFLGAKRLVGFDPVGYVQANGRKGCWLAGPRPVQHVAARITVLKESGHIEVRESLGKEGGSRGETRENDATTSETQLCETAPQVRPAGTAAAARWA